MLDVSGFDVPVSVTPVVIEVTPNHKLVKLCHHLPWQEMLTLITKDLERTEKGWWWVGRPMSVRIHLGIYILQKLFNFTDRLMESQLKDNAAFQIFCGRGIVKKWRTPDHTKIETFRNRLSPATQRQLANLMACVAVKYGYADCRHLDVDSTVQEANIAYLRTC